MEKLIPLISELQDILYKTSISNQIKLPQIVVVGAQSTGKSSVLESVVGKEILPRGKGIVTRRPIEIQLIHIQDNKEWVEFADNKGEKVFKLEDICQIIEEQTEKLCQRTKEISSIPLKLKYFSPNVVDLLLVDLPGLTKNPVGDQPKNIEQSIKDLVLPYIQNPNSLILAVSKANDDLANSESLKLARQVDPDGNRTIGVITQLDVMDSGQDALQDLLNKTYPLKLGYVGVVCRGQKDIDSNKSIKQQILEEKHFFENHRTYERIQDKMGIPYLIKMLNLNFIKHIKKCLPNIRDSLQELLKIKEFDMQQLGQTTKLVDKQSQGIFILSLISKFANSFQQIIRGNYLKCENAELIGGSRINYIFFEVFTKSIEQINPFDTITDNDIRMAIKNANGLRPSLFVPEIAFENLVRQQITRLLSPSIQCCHLVYEELRRILYMINIPEVERYELLHKSIFNVMESVLSKCVKPSDEMIEKLIEIELGYINTNHPDFVGGTNALISLMQDEEDEQKQFVKNPQYMSDSQQMIDKLSDIDLKEQTDSKKGWLWNPFNSNNKQNKQAEQYDNKLNMLQLQKSSFKSDGNAFQGYNGKDYFQSIEFSGNRQHQLPQVPSQIKTKGKTSKREQTEIDMIKKLITSYFDVIKKNISDSVPKTVITLLVNQSQNICERELISNLYQEKMLDDLLVEDAFIGQMREETKNNIDVIRQSLSVLNNIDSKF